MRKQEKYIVPAQAERVELRETVLICDLCGAESHHRDNWSDEPYSFAEVEINSNYGDRYPNMEGYKTEVFFDLCPNCFDNVLVPFLKSKGAEPQEKTTDW